MKRALWSVLVVLACTPAAAAPASPPASQKLARAIFRELVEIDTTQSVGDTAKAARAMAARLRAAGFAKGDVQVFEPRPKRGNLIARLRGTGKRKPLLLVAHLDVVEAKREDWTTEPFKLVEKDGYFYGRGTADDKFMVAAWVADMCRWKQEGFKPDRDLVLVLESDEELVSESRDGMTWLLAHHKDLLDAELALNEGGWVATTGGKPAWQTIQTAEKVFQTFTLEVRNRGGHSSVPRKDNAIYQLSAALVKLQQLAFPVALNPTTRAYFEKMAAIDHNPLAADMKAVLAATPDRAAIARLATIPAIAATIRTTCVATRLEGGHADNALPQLARATVNCRIVPGHKVEDVQAAIEHAIDDPEVVVAAAGHDVASEPSALPPELMTALEQVSQRFWPGVPVVPAMGTGSTDGRFLRNAGIPTFGVSGLASDITDVRIHGKDERVAVAAFDDGLEFLYELVEALSGGTDGK